MSDYRLVCEDQSIDFDDIPDPHTMEEFKFFKDRADLEISRLKGTDNKSRYHSPVTKEEREKFSKGLLTKAEAAIIEARVTDYYRDKHVNISDDAKRRLHIIERCAIVLAELEC